MTRISIFLWILKVLLTCKTIEHLNGCMFLIQRNHDLYEDIGIHTYLCDIAVEMYDEFKTEIEQAYAETNEHLEQ